MTGLYIQVFIDIFPGLHSVIYQFFVVDLHPHY